MSFTANIDDIVAQNRNQLLGKHPTWERVRLREVATILNGYPFESVRFRKTGGTPLIRIRDILAGRTETFYGGSFDPVFMVNRGEILIGMDGDFNSAPWTGEPALLNQRVCKITADESRYSKQFLRYVLPGYLNAINAETPSVTVKHLSSRTIGEIPLPLPPLCEQRRIVVEIEKQFTRLNSGTAALQRVGANLKRYRASVLKSAFEGRLVPTEANLGKHQGGILKFETGEELLARLVAEGREKGKGRGKYEGSSSNSAADFPPAPEGWTRATLSQLADTSSGGTPNRGTPSFYGGTIPWIKSGELNDGHVRTAEEFISGDGLENSSAKLFPKGTLCIALYGATVGKLGILDITAATNQAVCGIFPSAGLSVNYLFYFLRSQRHELIERGKGGGTTEY